MKLEEKVIEYFKQIPKDVLAKSLAVAIFRNGEIEDIHSDSNKNITDEDMKILNKAACCIAEKADTVIEVVAGIPIYHKGEKWVL